MRVYVQAVAHLLSPVGGFFISPLLTPSRNTGGFFMLICLTLDRKHVVFF